MKEQTIIQMTFADLQKFASEIATQTAMQIQRRQQDDDEYVYGIQALANLIGCKKSSAQKLSNSGKIDFAKGRKYGKEIPFNKQKILAFLNN